MADFKNDGEMLIQFSMSNSHTAGSKAYELYERIKNVQSVQNAKDLGASTWNLREYHSKGLIEILVPCHGKGGGGGMGNVVVQKSKVGNDGGGGGGGGGGG